MKSIILKRDCDIVLEVRNGKEVSPFFFAFSIDIHIVLFYMKVNTVNVNIVL